MRSIFLFLILLATGIVVQGQKHIVAYEYWPDNNYAARTRQDVSADTVYVLQSAIDYSYLSNGVHFFNLRFMQSDGEWSSVLCQSFAKLPAYAYGTPSVTNAVVAIEYWVDTDYSQLISQVITPTTSFNLLYDIDFSALSNGVHTLNMRFKQTDGEWSNLLCQMFAKFPSSPADTVTTNKMVAYEYWADTAFSARVSQTLAPASAYNLLSAIDYSSLSNGIHSFNVRFRQTDGKWGSVLCQMFAKFPSPEAGNVDTNYITSYEYWFNDGFANRTVVHPSLGQVYTTLDSLNTDTLKPFIDVFHARYRDSKGAFVYIDQDFNNFRLNLSIMLEGLYDNDNGAMRKTQNETGNNYPETVSDTLSVQICEGSFPYNPLHNFHAVALHSDGSCQLQGIGTDTISFPLKLNSAYYIVLKHRNSIETWSANPVVFTGTNLGYSFSNAATAAFGNNLKQNGSVFLVFSGDVNQDGVINDLDLAAINAHSTSFGTGYITEDTNGDGIVDALDLILTDNNAANFVMLLKP